MTYIAQHEYFGLWANHPDVNDEMRKNAEVLLSAVNALMEEAFDAGIDLHINPTTKSHVSGKQFGGFRPQNCCEGAPLSSHKQAKAVDIYDKGTGFAEWCAKHQDKLQAHGLYMEAPVATPTWCHLTTRPPKSGKRVFTP